MSKRAEDLPLDDTPRPLPPDARDAEWYQFCSEIDDLILGDDYAWALDTLEGIRASVEEYKSVTEGQRRAVENIQAARQHHRSGRPARRRYEGFRR